LHVVVVDEDGVITGSTNTVLEKYYALSKASDAKSDIGGTNYYKDIINERSSIFVGQIMMTQGQTGVMLHLAQHLHP
jgi:hypothetical protein